MRDNGRGIRPVDRPHVFAPLFTTRPEGSGMGLAICRDILASNGGGISVDCTSRRRGVRLVIELPLKKSKSTTRR